MKKTMLSIIILFAALILLSCPAVFSPEPFGRWNPADPEYDAATDPDAGTKPGIPSPVTGFTATAGAEDVTLAWTNPVSGFVGVLICFSTSAFPNSPEDGTELYDDTGSTFVHSNIVAGTYYYSAFAYNASNTYAERATAEAAPCRRLRVYIANSESGLAIIDVNDPENPGTTIYRDTNVTAYGVAVTADYVFVAAGFYGLAVFDVSDPTNPGNHSYLTTNDYANDVVVYGDYAYIADGEAGLMIVDVSTPFLTDLVGSVDTSINAVGVVIQVP